MIYNLFFTILIIIVIVKYNKGQEIKGMVLYLHVAILWLLLMIFSSSLEMLGWVLANANKIDKYFYVQIGPIPDWINLLMWLLNLLFGLYTLYLILSLAKRKEKARKALLYILPILYILTAYGIIRGFYLANTEGQEQSFILVSLVCLSISLILYLPIYYFYKNKKIKDKIFIY